MAKENTTQEPQAQNKPAAPPEPTPDPTVVPPPYQYVTEGYDPRTEFAIRGTKKDK